MNAKRIILSLFICILAFLSFSLGVSAAESDKTAENIEKKCTYTFSSNESKKKKLIDNDLDSLYYCERSGSQYIEVDFNNQHVQGIYIKWRKPCYDWDLHIDTGNGYEAPIPMGQYGYVQEYIELDSNVKRIKLSTDDASVYPLEILDFFVYDNSGALPSSVHKWNPTPSIAELMVVSTHQDDELLFFGGTIPYYSNELGLDTVVIYMAYDTGMRLHEALEGLWVCGYKQTPIFICLPDKYCMELKKAERYWDRKETTKELTEYLLKYKPQVIVTHDEEGEYGHGQHILTVECIKDAIINAADSAYVSENFPTEETYNVPKCYLHLYKKNKVVIPWDKLTISSKNGKSSLSVAQSAFKQHTSQWSTGFRVRMEGANNCSKFGLYHTTVGKDTLCNDFFENITLRLYDLEVPDEKLTSEFSSVPNFKKLYIYTDPITSDTQYLRYGIVSDSDGWYCADETGAPIIPAVSFEYFADMSCTDISTYETVSVSDISPLLFAYKSEPSAKIKYARYGTYNSNIGWFIVDESGQPISKEPIELLKTFPVPSSSDVNQDSVQSTPSKSISDNLNYYIGILIILVLFVILIVTVRKSKKK